MALEGAARKKDLSRQIHARTPFCEINVEKPSKGYHKKDGPGIIQIVRSTNPTTTTTK
jgi:hypothetical protein